jgi:hypothetical protein
MVLITTEETKMQGQIIFVMAGLLLTACGSSDKNNDAGGAAPAASGPGGASVSDNISNILSIGPKIIYLSCNYNEENTVIHYRIKQDGSKILSFDAFDVASNQYENNTVRMPSNRSFKKEAFWISEEELKGQQQFDDSELAAAFKDSKLNVNFYSTEDLFSYEYSYTTNLIFPPAFQLILQINRNTGALIIQDRISTNGPYETRIVGECVASEDQIKKTKKF